MKKSTDIIEKQVSRFKKLAAKSVVVNPSISWSFIRILVHGRRHIFNQGAYLPATFSERCRVISLQNRAAT